MLRHFFLITSYIISFSSDDGTNKGFILYLDGSAEAGDEITFISKERMTGITIDSWILPSESRHYIDQFLQHI